MSTITDEGRAYLLSCMPRDKTLDEIPTRELEHYARRVERVLHDERVQKNLLHNIHKHHNHFYSMKRLLGHTRAVMQEINMVLMTREDRHAG